MMTIPLILESYQSTLMYLGAFLFILLCGILVYYTIKKEEIIKLLWFFPIPIIMIAFPSISELVINQKGISIKNKIENVIENPDDPESKQELEEALVEAEKKANTPREIKKVAEANLILGNNEKVIELTEKALQKSDTNNEKENVKQLKDIKAVALTSKQIQLHERTISDTAILHRKIDQIKWENPKTKVYLNKKVDLITR